MSDFTIDPEQRTKSGDAHFPWPFGTEIPDRAGIFRGLFWALPIGVSFWIGVAILLWLH